jgi:hypothetical protein
MNRRTRFPYENTPADKLSLGRSLGVRPGMSPGMAAASRGTTLAVRPGRSPGQAVSNGASLAVRRFSRGGHLDKAGYLVDEGPGGLTRTKCNIERNQKLGAPHYSKGGHAHKKALKSLHKIYTALHHHFGGDSVMEKKKSGGKLWIQDAINPKHKGELHRELHVPQGKKIPLSKLHKAEHSSDSKLRKRAQLAENLRGFHHKSSRGR